MNISVYKSLININAEKNNVKNINYEIIEKY